MKGFTFYRTFVECLPREVPVTVGFEHVRQSLLKRIRGFCRVFMHSGNWWRLSKESRIPENLVKAYHKLSEVCRVEGVMSINVPPKRIGKYYDIWNYPVGVREEALEKSLEYADTMRRLLRGVRLYCSYEVGTFEDALKWYCKALERGHEALGAGFAAFLMGRPLPGAYERIVEVIVAAKVAGGWEVPFHASGVSSLRLLPLIYYAGATSADGSTPIRAALSYGVVFNERGVGVRVSSLKEWNCKCPFCSQYKPSELITMFRENYRARVLHNSHLWDSRIRRIVEAAQENRLEEFIASYASRPILRALDRARRLKKEHGLE